MSRLTDFLKLHIWEIPKDNNEKFNYTKAIADNFEKIDAGLQNAVSKFTEPISYKGKVATFNDLPSSAKEGNIYTVTSENKNYIWNGTSWEEYSSNIDLTPIEEQLKTTQATDIAEELSIPNTAPVNGKLDIKSGKSEQETRSGKNKFNINNPISKGANTTYTITKNVLNIKGIWHVVYKIEGLKANTTYYITGETKIITDNSSKGIGTISVINDGVTVGHSYNKKFPKFIHTTNTNTSISIYFYVGDGYTEGEVEYSNIQVAEEDIEYEEYGAMPSSDYPSPIRNVGDNINISPTSVDEWEQGTLNAGLPSDSTTRIRFKNFYPIKADKNSIRVHSNEDYRIINIHYYDSTKTFINDEYTLNYKTNYKENTFIPPAGTKYCKLVVGKEDNSTILPNEITSIKVKLEEGTIATSYSEHGCGSADFKVKNKNMFNINSSDILISAATSRTINDNVLKISGWSVGYRFKLEKNSTYYVKAKRNVISGDGGQIKITNASFTSSFKELGKNNGYFNTGDNEEIGIQFCSGWTIGGTCEFSDIILSKADIEYIPHQEQIVSFPFTEGQVLHKGDYLAEAIHQKRKIRVFDGTENWYQFGSNVALANWDNGETPIHADANYTGYLCNIAKEGVASQTENNNTFSTNHTSENSDWIVFNINTSVSDWKAMLAEQYANGTPVIVEYELAEEIVIPYTKEQEEAYYQLQHLLMYEGYTSIECIDEIKPDIQVTYSYNNEINKYYSTKIDELSSEVHELKKQVEDLTAMVLSM